MGDLTGSGGENVEGAELVVCSVVLLPYCKKADSVSEVAGGHNVCCVRCVVVGGKKLIFVGGAGSDGWEVFSSPRKKVAIASISLAMWAVRVVVSELPTDCRLSSRNPEAIALTVSFCFSISCFISCFISCMECDSLV